MTMVVATWNLVSFRSNPLMNEVLVAIEKLTDDAVLLLSSIDPHGPQDVPSIDDTKAEYDRIKTEFQSIQNIVNGWSPAEQERHRTLSTPEKRRKLSPDRP